MYVVFISVNYKHVSLHCKLYAEDSVEKFHEWKTCVSTLSSDVWFLALSDVGWSSFHKIL